MISNKRFETDSPWPLRNPLVALASSRSSATDGESIPVVAQVLLNVMGKLDVKLARETRYGV